MEKPIININITNLVGEIKVSNPHEIKNAEQIITDTLLKAVWNAGIIIDTSEMGIEEKRNAVSNLIRAGGRLVYGMNHNNPDGIAFARGNVHIDMDTLDILMVITFDEWKAMS